MEAILLDTVPAGTANPALPAGNASASSSSTNSPFANMLASATGEANEADSSDTDGRAASDATAAAALLALLLPQPRYVDPAAAESADIAIGATELDGQPSPEGLALGLNGLAPGQNDLATVPGKANGLAEEGPAVDANPLPDFKQDRNETGPSNGAAKTVSLTAAAQAQPATSTPLPPELIENQVAENNGIQVTASKAHETPIGNSTAPATTADQTRTAETPKPATPEPQTPPPTKSELADAVDDRSRDRSQDSDLDPSSSVTTSYSDRPRSPGATAIAHTAVEKLANLIDRPDLLAAHIERAVANGRDRISIALVPADLGRIDIAVDFDRSGKISAVIAVDRPQTLDLLRRDQQGLERALQDAGFRTDSGSLSFNLRGDQRQQQNPATPWTPARESYDAWQSGARALPTAAQPARLVAEGRLDIEV